MAHGTGGRFEDLQVWQCARELVKGAYRAARSQKLRQDSVLVHQMTRAAVSVVSNIAEGHERGSRAQSVEFCLYSKGSVGELRAQVIVAHDLGLLDNTAFEWLCDKCEQVSELLSGYIRYLRTNDRKVPSRRASPT